MKLAKLARTAAIAACAFAAGGVAAAAQQARSDALWLDVPFVHQAKDGCGSASLSMILQYWEQKNAALPPGRSDPAQIQAALYSRGAHGIYASAMQQYLEASGFRAFAFRGAWSDLAGHIAKGRPLIAALRPGPRAPYHYVVVAGIDDASQAVLLNDPARGKLLRVARSDFEKEWQFADCWLLLAVPKGPAPSLSSSSSSPSPR